MDADLVIVGAGPGGLMAANRAAELGLDTILIEKQYEIGSPIRTTGGSFVQEMQELGIPPQFYNPIRRVTFATTENEVEFTYPNDAACVLDLRGAYQFLAFKAAEKGCRIELGLSVQGGIKEGNRIAGVRVSGFGRDKQISSKFVVDASGLSAVVAKDAGLVSQNWTAFGSGVEFEAYIEHLEKDKAQLLVGEKIAPTGYAWVFPVSDNRARVGVGVTRPYSNLSPYTLLENMIANRPKALQSLGRITPIEVHAGNVPIEIVPAKTTSDGLIVIGDAAGQANPIVGEGIRIAMKFGKLAAEAIAKSIGMNDLTGRALAEYEKEVARNARHNYIGLRIQKRIVGNSDAEWNDGIEKLKSLTPEEFMTFLKADFSKRNLLSAILKHPGLAGSTTLSLLKESF